MEQNKAQAKVAQEKHDELLRVQGESKQTVATLQSKVPFVSCPRILIKAYMGVMQIDRLLSSLLSLCAQVGVLEKENQGLRATLELARTANTCWSRSWGEQDKELQCRQAEIEKLKDDLAKVRCCVSFALVVSKQVHDADFDANVAGRIVLLPYRKKRLRRRLRKRNMTNS